MTDAVPWCPTCKTAEHLAILDFVPAHAVRRKYTTAQGVVHRERTVAPFASYRCEACGYYNGHEVADGWVPPGPTQD